MHKTETRQKMRYDQIADEQAPSRCGGAPWDWSREEKGRTNAALFVSPSAPPPLSLVSFCLSVLSVCLSLLSVETRARSRERNQASQLRYSSWHARVHPPTRRRRQHPRKGMIQGISAAAKAAAAARKRDRVREICRRCDDPYIGLPRLWHEQEAPSAQSTHIPRRRGI